MLARASDYLFSRTLETMHAEDLVKSRVKFRSVQNQTILRKYTYLPPALNVIIVGYIMENIVKLKGFPKSR